MSHDPKMGIFDPLYNLQFFTIKSVNIRLFSQNHTKYRKLSKNLVPLFQKKWYFKKQHGKQHKTYDYHNNKHFKNHSLKIYGTTFQKKWYLKSGPYKNPVPLFHKLIYTDNTYCNIFLRL